MKNVRQLANTLAQAARHYGVLRLLSDSGLILSVLATIFVWLWAANVPSGWTALSKLGSHMAAICGGLLGLVLAAQAIIASFAHSRLVKRLHERGMWQNVLFLFWYDGSLSAAAIVAGIALTAAEEAVVTARSLHLLSLFATFFFLYALIAAVSLLGTIFKHATRETELELIEDDEA